MKIQQIQNKHKGNYKKGTWGTVLGGGASAHAPPPRRRVEPRAAACDQQDRGHMDLPLLFKLSPTVTCHATENTRKQQTRNKIQNFPDLLFVAPDLGSSSSAAAFLFIFTPTRVFNNDLQTGRKEAHKHITKAQKYHLFGSLQISVIVLHGTAGLWT